MSRRLEAQAGDPAGAGKVLADGERILCVVRARPGVQRQPAGFGGIPGLVADLITSADQAHRPPLPVSLADVMLVVLTDARVLVWSYVGLFRPRPYTLLGTIAIDDIANVQFSGRLGLLSLWLPHRTFDLRVDDADSARRFAATAREQIAART